MLVLSEVDIVLQLVIQSQLVLLLRLLERIQANRLELCIPHCFPASADFPDELSVGWRSRHISFTFDSTFEFPVG